MVALQNSFRLDDERPIDARRSRAISRVSLSLWRSIGLLATAVALVLLAREAALARRPHGPAGERRITCESRGRTYDYCQTGTIGFVRLERRLSDAPCRQYESWGADADGAGIWVARGCRAVFVVSPYRPRPPRRKITCESRGRQYHYCRTGTRGFVRLEHRLSDAPCRQYDTWGADDDGGGVWVGRGCRAVFVVE
jgi:hypothetical protein